MTSNDEWAPPGVDTSVPSIARVYDCFLGGKDNFAVDRAVVEQVVKVMPDGWDKSEGALDNRAFLRRVVRHLVNEAGIRQFIDFGSGLPSQGNVHEVAQACAPEARVVYVDNDPIVLAHGRALLAGAPGVQVITADVREPGAVLAHEAVRRLIDFSEPVGLLMFAILHHVNDAEDPEGIAAHLRDAVVPGSHLAVSHFYNPRDEVPETAPIVAESERIFNSGFGTGRWRTREEITAYFGDFEVLEPGLVPLPAWRPEPGTQIDWTLTRNLFVGGVARKN